MSFLDKAKDLLNQHDDKVDQALDKAGEAAKERFTGHDSQIDNLVDQAQQRTGEGDTTQAPPPAANEGAPGEGQPQHGEVPPHQR
ncbi:antitoxin [Pseudonocardia sp.]|uniref:antitoxin n=1 Tax=Pseudonocardia sp. TaxID=60912 RepID=UPI002632589F|nr:antitoxin [Pseudonocardia sp.]